ncbi:MAG: diacylglycerol kinase family protein [Verrucomicrobiales bacterium]|nr:diacylglycerol kinase family protein [Verrucomicrobiales bacterium]
MQVLQSFADAGRGIISVFRTERNFRIHLILLLVAIVLGFWLSLSAVEWIALLLCSAGVLIGEVFNTALEYLADAVHPEMDPGIGRAKDASAGAVLIAALAAAIVGAILFLPKLWDLLIK